MRKTVAVDASFLAVLLDKRARASVENGPERIARLIEDLSAVNAKVIIPVPVLAEVLKYAATAGPAYMEHINKCPCFQIRPFDDKAAIELAQLLPRETAVRKDLLKFDRQSVAIAKVYGASTLYTNDEKMLEFAAQCGLETVKFK